MLARDEYAMRRTGKRYHNDKWPDDLDNQRPDDLDNLDNQRPDDLDNVNNTRPLFLLMHMAMERDKLGSGRVSMLRQLPVLRADIRRPSRLRARFNSVPVTLHDLDKLNVDKLNVINDAGTM